MNHDNAPHPTILHIDDVCLSYGERHVLCHISESVKKNDFIVLTGPNGGGKTTLLRLIAGLISPTCGKIVRRPNLRIGYLPQYRHIDRQFPARVSDIVRSGLCNRTGLFQRFSPEMKTKTDDALRLFHLESLAARPIAELSGGQWQRTLLARAFVSEPDLLLLDEPETHLDEDSRSELYTLLQTWNAGRAIVVVSHDEHRFPQFSNRRIWHVDENQVTERDSW